MTIQHHTPPHRPACRRLLALTAAAAAVATLGLSGCAVYAPPYAAYDAAYDAVPTVQPYYYGPYAYGPYAYGRPAYVGPPVSLNFGYYTNRYRGNYGWRGHGWGGGRGGYGGRGGRGGFHGGGYGHR